MSTNDRRISRPVATVVLIGAAVVLAGGLVAWLHPALLLPAGTPVTHGVRLYAARMAARALPLGTALVVLLLLRARRLLAGLLVLVAAIEVGDTVAAVANRDWAELSGLAVAFAFLWAATRLTPRTPASPRP